MGLLTRFCDFILQIYSVLCVSYY
uniref:Uncharacterized protein n=1 Tax=Rhizophora mucronata TaxID=61149 RepID=A0A2P2Q7G0_RHIMU